MTTNHATSQELSSISMIGAQLEILSNRLVERKEQVSFNNVQLFDVNGESLGYLVEEQQGIFTFRQEPLS